jgi:UDP-N-acetylmuramoyl-tripeptide--D-alanyl-D-alanine ligase
MRIVTATGAQVLGRPPFGSFTSVSTDTRTIEPGALFIALRGESFDGHDYLSAAEEGGAMAAIVNEAGLAKNSSGLPLYIVQDTLKAYQDLATAYRRLFDIPVVGITGTVGKTTTKDFVAAVLGLMGDVVATRANHNNEIGAPQTLFRVDDDTAAAVVEMGMRGPGQIAELTRIAQPTCGIITAIGKTHAEFFATGVEGIAEAKAELLDGMPEGAPVALPADSDWRPLLQRHARGPVTSFGFEEAADIRAEHYRLVGGGATFRIETPNGGVNVELTAPGRHLAVDAAAAFAVALWHDIPLEAAARALEGVSMGRHRLQVYEAPGGFTVIDDCYNAGPESVRAALEVLRDWPAQRRIALLGDMRELGPAEAEEHAAIGREACRSVDALLTYGAASRTASDAAREAGHPASAHAEDLDGAIRFLRERLQPGDVVLVKGSRALGLEHVVEGLLK